MEPTPTTHLLFEPLHLLHSVPSLSTCTSRPSMDKRAEESAAFSVRVFSLREDEEKEKEEEAVEEGRVEMELPQRPQEVRRERTCLYSPVLFKLRC